MSAKERPILMSGAMVRASLREVDPKTQTRRVMKKQPPKKHDVPLALNRGRSMFRWGVSDYPKGEGPSWELWPEGPVPCPYGKPGDRLWVRESFGYCNDEPMFGAFYRAEELANKDYAEENGVPRWRPSIHMPRWACRLVLEITDVRVERLQDISEADALAEGMTQETAEAVMSPEELAVFAASHILTPKARARIIFETVWEKINGPGSWWQNPWVWVVEFKRVLPA